MSQHTSSSVDATTSHLGIITTTYSSFSNLLLSSSLVWAMSGHLSRIHRRSAVTPSSWIHDCVNLFTALWYYKSTARQAIEMYSMFLLLGMCCEAHEIGDDKKAVLSLNVTSRISSRKR